jgi:hypothetical protein
MTEADSEFFFGRTREAVEVTRALERARRGFRRPYDANDHPDWEEVMPKLMGFSRFAALLEEQISEKISRRILAGDQGMVVWWSTWAGVHVEPHSHPNE